MNRLWLASALLFVIAVMASAQTMGPVYLNGSAVPNGAVYSQITPLAYASLTACTAPLEGTLAAVNNSNTATYGAAVAGGGTNHVLAYCNGTAWTVH